MHHAFSTHSLPVGIYAVSMSWLLSTEQLWEGESGMGWERRPDTYTLPSVKQEARRSLLQSSGSSAPCSVTARRLGRGEVAGGSRGRGYAHGLCLLLSCFSRVQLFVTLWTVACLSMGFSRQEIGCHALLRTAQFSSVQSLSRVRLFVTP